MNRWMTAACAAALLGAGCTKSEVNADADIVLGGRVLRADKQPLANTLLTLHRSSNSSCVFTLLFDDLNWKSMKTAADGTFRQELLGADTQNGSTARCFSLSVPGTGQGDSLYAEFIVRSEQVQLPDLQQWTGTPSAAAAATGVNVSFQELSAAQEGASGGAHSLSIEKRNSGSVWSMGAPGSPTLVNDDLLEDSADLTATPLVRREVTVGKHSFFIFQEGTATALPRRARLPVSRGAACGYAGAPTVCPLTDGELGKGVSFPLNTREVVIQLAQPRPLRKAVLRNLSASIGAREVVLEGSADGAQWVGLANLLGGESSLKRFHEVTLSPATPLSHVRVRVSSTEENHGVQGLSEVSLFE